MMKIKINDIIVKKKEGEARMLRSVPPSRSAKKFFNKGKLLFVIAFLFVFALLGVKAVNFFSGVVVRVSLLKETAHVDSNLRAGSDNADLVFETVEFDVKKSRSFTAAGFNEVKLKASGLIVVYNAFSSQPQPLIKDTRFEAPGGEIYRINKNITVPGAKVSDGKLVPSSVEVAVYADQPGEKYNIGLTDFTIPGFKGGPRYDKFYGRSKTEMTGGFIGKVPKVDDEEFASIKKSLDDEMKKEMLNKVQQGVPDGYVFYDDAAKIIFSGDEKSSDAAFEANGSSFTVERSGKIFSYLFPRKELSKALVKKYLGEEFQGKVVVKNLAQLKFKIIREEVAKGSLVFNVNGDAEFIWVLNEEELKRSLVASPDNPSGVFASYQAIGKAEVFFKPPWWKFFPQKTERISVEYD